jgi:hypothetical protein
MGTHDLQESLSPFLQQPVSGSTRSLLQVVPLSSVMYHLPGSDRQTNNATCPAATLDTRPVQLLAENCVVSHLPEKVFWQVLLWSRGMSLQRQQRRAGVLKQGLKSPEMVCGQCQTKTAPVEHVTHRINSLLCGANGSVRLPATHAKTPKSRNLSLDASIVIGTLRAPPCPRHLIPRFNIRQGSEVPLLSPNVRQPNITAYKFII